MSKKVSKSKAKALRKENAIKKARLKTFIVVMICVLIVVAVAVIGIHVRRQNHSQQVSMEIYSFHGQTVQLLDDGTFSARLAHGVQKNGTYTKTNDNDGIIVSFNVNGREEVGRIQNNNLYIPREWDDGHGHGNVFRRTE